MDWIEVLHDKDYVLADLLPGIIRAAIIDKSSQAMYLLASVLLMRSVKAMGKVSPLKVIYDPAEALCDSFPGAEKIWGKSGELDLLCQVPELILDRKREILVDVIEQIKARNACRCRFHLASDGSDYDNNKRKCVIPSVCLWETIANFLGACSNRVNQDLIGSPIFTMNGELRKELTSIEKTVKVPDLLLKQFEREENKDKKNKYRLTENAVIASADLPNADAWIVTDYAEPENNESEHDEDDFEDESVVLHYIHYFIVAGPEEATNRAIQVHHHLRRDIANDLDRIIDLLTSKDEDIAGTPWWAEEPASETELREWSRFRAVFFFSLVKRVVQNTAFMQTDHAQSRLLGKADVTEAIKDMKACWEQAGHASEIGIESLDLLGSDVTALSEIQDGTKLSHEIRERIIRQEDYPALEKCVMQCVCGLIDLVIQHTPVSSSG